MEEVERDRPPRHRAARRPPRGHAATCGTTSDPRAGAPDGGPRAGRALPAAARRRRARSCCGSRACAPQGALQRRQLHAAPRRGPRGRRASWARGAPSSRARPRRRRPARRGRVILDGRGAARLREPRGRHRRAASACCPRTARPRAWCWACPCRRTSPSRARAASRRLGVVDAGAGAATSPQRQVDDLRIKTPGLAPAGGLPFRREPAEGRARQVAGRETWTCSSWTSPRAASTWRAKVEIYELMNRAHRARARDPDDLVGAARGAGHERPHPGHAPRARRRASLDGHGRDPGRRCWPRRWARRRDGARACCRRRRGRSLGTLVGLFAPRALCSPSLTPHFLTVSNLLNVMEQTVDQRRHRGGHDVRDPLRRNRPLGGLAGRALRRRAGERAPDRAAPAPRAILAGLLAGAACGLVNGLLITHGPAAAVHRDPGHDERGPRPRPPLHRRPARSRASTRASAGSPPAASLVIPVPVHRHARRLPHRRTSCSRATRFGRYVYAIGGNEEATRLSGVAVRFHKTMVYALSGLVSAPGRGAPHRAAQLRPAHRRDHVRARRDRRHRHRRHEPPGRRGHASAAR